MEVLEENLNLFISDFKNRASYMFNLYNSILQLFMDGKEKQVYDILVQNIDEFISKQKLESINQFIDNYNQCIELISSLEKICYQIPFEKHPIEVVMDIFWKYNGKESFLIVEKYIIDEVIKKENSRGYHPLPNEIEQVIKILIKLNKKSTDFGDEFHSKTRRFFTKFKDEIDRTQRDIEFYKKIKIDPSKPRLNIIFSETDTTNIRNVKFYSVLIPSQPDGIFLDEIHRKWYGDYSKLEMGHSYIQWLFPIREGGLNSEAQSLTLNEAKIFQNDPEKFIPKFLKSYEMMMDFYGIKLKDSRTGELERSKDYKKRFEFLNESYHNYLRITRILKCLGLIGLDHFKIELLKFFIFEIFENGFIPNAKQSLVNYWIPSLRKKSEIKQCEKWIEKITGKIINKIDYKFDEKSWANIFIDDLNEKDEYIEHIEYLKFGK